MTYDQRLWPLIAGELDPMAYGLVEWSGINGAWRGRLPVTANGFGDGELSLEMVVRPGPRAVEPTVTLIALGRNVRRVDVNGVHRDDGVPRRQTHIQGEPPPNFFEWIDPNQFPPFPESGTVGGADYDRIFRACAASVGVDVSGVTWNDPPEGRPS